VALFLNGRYEDFTVEWYQQVGTTIVIINPKKIYKLAINDVYLNVPSNNYAGPT
jgi:hypothetical protein